MKCNYCHANESKLTMVLGITRSSCNITLHIDCTYFIPSYLFIYEPLNCHSTSSDTEEFSTIIVTLKYVFHTSHVFLTENAHALNMEEHSTNLELVPPVTAILRFILSYQCVF